MNRHTLVRQRNFMNTTITISVVKPNDWSTIATVDAIDAAFGEFDRIVEKFTRFKDTSELAALNNQSGQWVNISPEFYSLISDMLQMAKDTNGNFDPTIIDFLETYGYDKNYEFSKLDNPDIDKMVNNMANSRPSWKDIELKDVQVKLAPKQRLDLGGLGKGYAIDCAYQKLLPTQNFLIDAGGDIRAQGLNQDNQLWQVGLIHKHEGQEVLIGKIELTNQSLAASGSWARKVKQFHHIINPLTGKPTEEMLTAFIIGTEAKWADAWATALFVGGEDLLSALPSGMEAMLIGKDNQVTATPNFPSLIAKHH